MLKLDYLKNEKSFRSEIKIFFLVLKVLSFRHSKQTSKNVADTTFKLKYLTNDVFCEKLSHPQVFPTRKFGFETKGKVQLSLSNYFNQQLLN